MNTLRVVLKQHTPLLHFQPDQDGATLRASEVKPKLDKFLIKKVVDGNAESYGSFLKDKESCSLNYKLRIIPNGNNLLSMDIINDNNGKYNTNSKYFPQILSNMGGCQFRDELVNFSFYETVTLEFISTCSEVNDIADWIDVFFAMTNFGQRSDKGFGSFSVQSINGEKCGYPEDMLPERTGFLKFKVKDYKNIVSQSKVFQVIDFYWKVIKSGINYTRKNQFPGRYIKSFLWIYLNNNGTTWEKRKIKESFNLTTGNEHKENPHPAYFSRALLGCTDKFEYKNKRQTVQVKQLNENINIIPSPVIFKPIFDGEFVQIYLIVDNSAINELKKISDIEVEFKCNSSRLIMSINPELLDVNDLIDKYHKFLCGEVRNKIVHNGNNLGENAFVPVDFNWRPIVSKVSIRQIKL